MHRCFFLIFLVLCFNGCQSSENNNLSKIIKSELLHSDNKVLKLAELIKFEWEKLYVFGPYVDKNTIYSVVNKDLSLRQSFNYVSEGDTMLVFTNAEVVSKVIFLKRSEVDFSELGKIRDQKDAIIAYKYYTPETAMFKIVIQENYNLGNKWYKLEEIR